MPTLVLHLARARDCCWCLRDPRVGAAICLLLSRRADAVVVRAQCRCGYEEPAASYVNGHNPAAADRGEEL